jgi:nondiscriminating glutamyl-tRNA synthetase
MNAHYIKELPLDELVNYLTPFLVAAGLIKQEEVPEKQDWLSKIAEILRDRIEYFAQAPQQLDMIFKNDYVIEDEEALTLLREESSKRLYTALIKKPF